MRTDMGLLDKFLSFLGFEDLIKIEGKDDFDQLSLPEIGLLIDSFLEEDSEYFDALAFNDFLHWKLKNEELKRIQRDLNKNSFIPVEGGGVPDINVVYLRALSKKLKAGPSSNSGSD